MNIQYIKNVENSIYSKQHNGLIQYGTSGFRTKADYLEHVLYRMGVLAVLRSKICNAAIGLMITASHNVESDNGVKLVDPNGEMLETSWEIIANDLANANDTDVITVIQRIINELKIDMSVSATVITGRDTRKSSPSLLDAALAGIRALNGIVKDFGIVTTPQLHYLVVCTNTNGNYGEPTLKGYYTKFSKAFERMRKYKNSFNNDKYIAELQLDAANGVGALAMKEFQKHIGSALKVNIYNDGNGELNHMCGADYVKIQQKVPLNMQQEANVRCASIDGDADRIVYFYVDEIKKFHILDGDRIATLVAGYIKELLEESSLQLNLGLVQTAYANAGSSNYISQKLKVPVACVSTGVKHLHSKATEFDIGVYFEANGHGTVVFKETAIQSISNAAENLKLKENERTAAGKLVHIINIINQTVGDALSDMLLIETILHSKGWSIIEWEQSYTDLPNKQMKVKVKDRNIITTANAERQCVTPIGLQDEIDKVVANYSKGRSFIRPSGTEDIVRVYAECENLSDVDKLAVEVSLLVYRLAGGIGPEPTL
ncbi:phosphoacetylglucosamine mutase [Vespa crabro]|uniref:phosphoacetylglucosamine mutase n=1 Tax=Vespa crabro TaxID=7445 RepID=UPI001F0226C4|nr:phosphoacetylglucosamine mutase [Vespa crabro]